MLIHGTAGRLHHEYIGATHVFLNLNVGFAVGKALDQRLPTIQAEKDTDLFGQRLIRCTAENLKFVVQAPTMRFALRLLVRAHKTPFFGSRRQSRHDCIAPSFEARRFWPTTTE